MSVLLYDKDPMLHHSKNTGMSNVWRTCGFFAAILTLLLDMGKAVLSLWICHFFVAPPALMCLGFFCVFFHCYSIFLEGKGGKGVASSGGVLLYFAPVVFVYTFGFWIVLQFLLKKASLASLGATGLALGIIWMAYSFLLPLVISMTLLIIWRHKENLSRLWKKEELSF